MARCLRTGGNMKLRYPKTIWKKVKSELAPTESCIICGKKFSKDSSVAMKVTQFSWFQGDDIREVFCMECLPSKEKRRPENLRM